MENLLVWKPTDTSKDFEKAFKKFNKKFNKQDPKKWGRTLRSCTNHSGY